MKVIELTRGKKAIVDDEDYEKVTNFSWHFNPNGYAESYFVDQETGKTICIRMHRMIMGAEKNQMIDHVNGNGLDNRKENLRFCTRSQNAVNSKLNKNNSSGFKGVCRAKNSTAKIWKAQVQTKRKPIYLGLFENPIDAARAYDETIERIFGEFALTNKKLNLLTK